MPQYSDDLFLGTAITNMGMNLGDPSPMSQGVGPLGRIYVWDVVPLVIYEVYLICFVRFFGKQLQYNFQSKLF